MGIGTRIAAFCLLITTIFILGAGTAKYTEETVTGTTQGNHDLDCSIIMPWKSSTGPAGILYPVIVWANGWGYNDNAGDFITDGYKPGLIEWALDGPYIIVAANQWSVQESDVLQCLEFVLDNYSGIANPERIGLAGHSQGGGAVIKAGDGEPNGFEITAVVAMNPYGPGWVNPGKQDGPLMLIGGTDDTTTPTSSFLAVWEAIQANGIGGLLAELIGGTHNDDAWAPEGEDPAEYNFGRYQEVTELWWQFHLNGKAQSGRLLQRLLDRDPWITQYMDGSD